MMHQVRGDHVLQHRLPLAKPGTDGEAVDSALDLGTPLPHVVLNVKQEGLLPKVGVHNLPRCLQAYGGVEVGREVCEGCAKAVAILGVEAGAVDEVDTAANHISCGKCGTIWLASPRGAEGMPIITMVTIGMFIPTRKSVHVDALS